MFSLNCLRSIIAIGGAMTVLTACASSSGVFPIGPNTYRVATTAQTSMGGEATAKEQAYKEATQKCQEQGQQLNVTDETADAQFTGASVTVTFTCVGTSR